MSQELIKSLIVWGPTLLFLLVLGFYFLVGVIRGLRKSVILLIHATASMTICIIIFFSIVNSENIDQTMVSLINYILNMFGTSIQSILGVSEELTSVKDIILEMLLSSMSQEEVFYYVIVDAGAYLSALIELIYRMVLFIVLGVLHLLLVGFLNIIYHIFYPVRRKARRQKKAFENGDASSPYKKRRLMGGLVGVARGLISSVFALSFFGCLLFIVTGENDPLPDRKEGTTEEISFGDDTFNAIYDYYSYVCEMSDTGIFKVLNSIKDQEDVPYYFYICDLMLQGSFKDENLGLDDKFYVRRETGAYIGFVKNAAALIVKYAGSDVSNILGGDSQAMLNVLMDVVKNEDFVEEFSGLIDDFESKSFIISLSLSALTSFVNHIDLVLGEDSKVTKLVQKLFNNDTGIKVTDLATEADIKNLFKAVLNITSTALNDMEKEAKARESLKAGIDLKNFDIKLAFKYGSLLIDQIQSFSLFNDRKDIGNKMFKNIYEFCVEELIEDKASLPEISINSWVDEFNVLFDSVEPILNITAEVFDKDTSKIIPNVFNLFEGENGSQMEQEFDKLVSQLSKSNLLDIVFRSTIPGSAIDGILQNMTGNVDATMPKKFTMASTAEEPGELEVLLTVIKEFIKNDGGTIYELIADGTVDENDLKAIFELLNKDLNESEEIEEKLVDKLLESKALRYFLSAFVTYMNLGDIKLYITDSSAEKIEEVVKTTNDNNEEILVTKTYNVIKKEELSVLFDFILGSSDFVIDLLGNKEVDYIEVLTSDEITDLLKKSNLLKGIIAGVFISLTEDIDLVAMPKGYDDPEKWIKDGEVENIVDVIINLKDEKTESGESLLTSLMGGSIDVDTILNISGNTINEMYKSKVLKYTISNALTTFSDGDFAIVIPAVVCEIKHAPTTVVGKTVNIVSSDELINIFEQIKNIVDIDGSTINVKFANIFNNKKEILKSYTIQATIMNMLINMSNQEDSFISVPTELKEEYDEFINAELVEALALNKWFYSEHVSLLPEDSNVIDDELYLLFAAIQELVSDEYKTTDEEGNEIIKDDFNLDNIGDSIKIKKSSIDTITSSFVLNGTLTDTISANFATPLSALQNGVIKKNELESLLDSLFVILNKHEQDSSITLEEVEGIDVNTIRIARSDFDEYHIKSSVFMTAFSSMLSEVENVYIPVEATVEVDVIENKEYKRINRIIDNTMNGEESENEFDNLLECLFEFLGETDETTGEEIINLTDFEDVGDFKITDERVSTITASKVFSASISIILIEDDILVVPEKNDLNEVCTLLVDMVNQEYDKYILTSEELGNTLFSLIEMFGVKNAETNAKELGLEIDLNNFTINTPVINKIVDSAVLSTTISHYIVDKKIGVVPDVEGVKENIDIIEMNIVNTSYRIKGEELHGFMSTALELFGEENVDSGQKELNINNIKLSDITISNENVGYFDDSIIINSTVTNELAKVDALVIPTQSDDEEIADIYQVVEDSTSCAIIKDIVSFMSDIIDFFGGSINPNTLSTSTFTLETSKDLNGALWGTFAQQLIDNKSGSILIPDNDAVKKYKVLEFSQDDGIYTQEKYLVTELETNLFKNSLIRVLSEDNQKLTINLNEGVQTNEMQFEPNDSQDGGIFESQIFTATVAKSILDLKDTLTVPTIVQVDENFFNHYESKKTLREDQVKALFDSLFVTTNNQPIKINYFATDDMTFPKEEEKIREMLDSLIVAATISNEVVKGDIVVLKEVMCPYEYNGNTDGQLFIEKDNELVSLIRSLTVGLEKTAIKDLTFDHIAIPKDDKSTDADDEEYNTKLDVLSDSLIVRATITKEVVNGQEKSISIEAKQEVCEVFNEYDTTNRVIVISKAEMLSMIRGLNVLTGNENSNFDKIVITVTELRAEQNKRQAVADSSVLRSILTNTLKEEYNGIPYYKFINMDEPIETEVYESFVITNDVVLNTLFTKEQIENLPTL